MITVPEIITIIVLLSVMCLISVATIIFNIIIIRRVNEIIRSNSEIKDIKKQFSGTANKITETHRVVNDIIGYVRDIATKFLVQTPRQYNGQNGGNGYQRRDYQSRDNRNGGGYQGNGNGYNGRNDRPTRRPYQQGNDGFHFTHSTEDRVPDGKTSRDIISELTGDNLSKRAVPDVERESQVDEVRDDIVVDERNRARDEDYSTEGEDTNGSSEEK